MKNWADAKRAVMPMFWLTAVALGYAVTQNQTLAVTFGAAAVLVTLALSLKPGTLLVCVAILIPFRVVEAFVPIIRGGVTMADGFLVAFVLSALVRRRAFSSRRVSAMVVALLVAVIFVGLASIVNGGFYDVGVRKVGRVAVIFLSYLAAMRSLGREEAIRAAKVFVIACAASAVVGLAFMARSVGVPGVDLLRLWGGVEDPNQMAVVLGAAFVLALAWRPRDVPGGLWLGCTLMLLVAQLASVSRGGASAFAAGVLLVLILALWARLSGRSPSVFSRSGGILVLFAAAVGLGTAYIPSTITGTAVLRYQGLLNPTADATGAFRIRLWEAGGRMLAQSPVLGVGPGAFGLALVATGSFTQAWEAHSSIVEIAVETGYMGAGLVAVALGAWSVLAGRAYSRAIRTLDVPNESVSLASGLMGATGAVIVGGASLSNVLYQPLFAMLIILSIAVLAGQERVKGGASVEAAAGTCQA